MAAFDYTELAALASELLAEFGQDVSLSRTSAGAYDTATGRVTLTNNAITRKAALFDIKDGVTQIQGNTVEAGDKMMLLEPGVAPGIKDTVTVSGVLWSVMSFKETNPAGTAVLYIVHLRR